MPTYLESPIGLMLPPSRNGHALAEVERQYAVMTALYESRIADLEARLQEEGWLRFDQQGGQEFGRDALGKLTEKARAHYLKNPLINRAVEIGALYVWGQDLSVGAADTTVQAVVDRFWHDNRRTLTGQQASRLLEVELQVTGNVFLALFADRVTGQVRVRTVPMEEVREIVTNPQDRYEPWYYLRKWNETPIEGGAPRQMTAYYPDWQYQPQGARPDSIGGVEVRWDAPMLHVKAGAFPHWTWGVSEVYAALDWARAYKELLEDDATRSRVLARFVWRLTTPGGASGVAAAKTKLATTLGTPGGSGTETNPPPVSGSTFIGDKGVGFDPIRIAGATLPTDHSRPARLMAASALGLPDTFFGDVDQGTLATAKSLDRPTELRYSERRQLWRDVLTDLLQWVIDRDIEAPRGILRGQPNDDARTVELSWPSLLERSVTEQVAAIVDAATLKGSPVAGTLPEETLARLLMVALGVEDIDDELKKLEDERAEREEMAAQIAQQTQPGQDDDDDVSREAFVRALASIQEVLRAGAH